MRTLSLSDQPNVVAEESGGYFSFPALGHIRDARLLDRLPEQWTEQETAAMRQAFQSCYDNFQRLVDSAAAEGKRAVIKEHVPFLICPPGAGELRAWATPAPPSVDGGRRQQPPVQPVCRGRSRKRDCPTGRGVAAMRARVPHPAPGSGVPILLPGDAVLQGRRPLEAGDDDQRSGGTLMTSSGIMPGKPFQGFSVEDEAVKWRAEFGGAVATRLQQWVREAMADYEYLSARRLTL